MRLLYNTSTQLFQPYPREDDEAVAGLDPIYQVYDVIQADEPAYDPATHHLQSQESIDHEAKTVTRSWSIVANDPIPAPDAEAFQVREYLMRNNIALDTIPTLIASVTTAGIERDVALMRWDKVTSLSKDHPLVAAVAAQLGLNLDEVWGSILAIS